MLLSLVDFDRSHRHIGGACGGAAAAREVCGLLVRTDAKSSCLALVEHREVVPSCVPRILAPIIGCDCGDWDIPDAVDGGGCVQDTAGGQPGEVE